MRILSGTELVGYIKERQAKQVRNLRQEWKVFPRLAIVVASDSPVISTYVRLKQSYGADILVDVDVHTVAQGEVARLLGTLNSDPLVHGIILQLPLPEINETDDLVALIADEKDVDGLGSSGVYVPATASAIDWLVAGYNVTLKDKKIVIVGNGRLVGAPLAKLWLTAGHNVTVCDDKTPNLQATIRSADIVVTATGVPGLITSAMVAPGKVLIDAGTASEGGVIVGDVAPKIRERTDLAITPERGGVGPLTIAALFDNVITAARKVADINKADV